MNQVICPTSARQFILVSNITNYTLNIITKKNKNQTELKSQIYGIVHLLKKKKKTKNMNV